MSKVTIAQLRHADHMLTHILDIYQNTAVCRPFLTSLYV